MSNRGTFRIRNTANTGWVRVGYVDASDDVVLGPTGQVKVVTTLGVGNVTPSTSGAGITFPATQSASSNANTLDDYEEGTWTPTIVGVSTYSTQRGTYIKIGRFVFIAAEIAGTDPGTLTALDVASFPFTLQSTITVYPVGNMFPVAGFTSNATSTLLQGTPGQAQGRVYWISSGTTNYNAITSSDLGTTFNFECSISYISDN
jgi:hypothetical protein